MNSVVGSTASALGNRRFRQLWAATWMRAISRNMDTVIMSWLVLELTNSPSRVALLGASRMAPMFVLGPVAGHVADHYSRVQAMTWAQVVRVLTALVILVSLQTGTMRVGFAIAYMAATGAAAAVDFSARRAYLSDILSADSLANAIALEAAAFTGSSMVGPVLGGALIPLAGYGGAFTVVALFCLAALALTASLDRHHEVLKTSEPEPAVSTDLRDVAKALWAIRPVRAVLMVTVVMNLFAFPYDSLVAVVARDVIGVGSALYGALGGAVGLGSLVGSLWIASRPIRKPRMLFSMGSALLMAMVFGFAFSPVYLLSLTLLLFAGLAIAGFDTTQTAIILQSVPPGIRGRSMGVLMLAIGPAQSLGIVLIGRLADSWGAQHALAVTCGTGLLLMAMLLRTYPELLHREA